MPVEDIQSLVEQLDQLVPKDNAKVEMKLYGGGPDESQMVATENGYLRFGVELMKGALMPTGEPAKNDSIQVDLDYLISGDSEVSFDFFRRCDSFPPQRHYSSVGSRISQVLIAVLLFGILALAIVGLVAMAGWVF